MADRVLRKMKRVELLEMMVRQGKAVGVLREQLEETKQRQKETEAEMQLMEETFARLRKKLDEKDEELLEQSQQMEETFTRLKRKLDEKDEELRIQTEQTEAVTERLKKKLDEKDEILRSQAEQMEATTERLKNKLDEKDATITKLRSTLEQVQLGGGIMLSKDSDSITDAASRLSRIVLDAQRATDRYLKLVRELEEQNESGDTSHESRNTDRFFHGRATG